MKKILICALLTLLPALLFYLAGAFIAWELNPENWLPISRAVLVWASFLLGIPVAVASAGLVEVKP